MRHHGIDLKEEMTYFRVAPNPRPYMQPAFEEGKKMADREIPTRVAQALRNTGGQA